MILASIWHNLRDIASQYRRYYRFCRWFFVDVFSRYRRTITTIVVQSLIGIGSLSGALLVSYFYLRIIEQGSQFAILGRLIEPDHSLTVLAIAATTVLTLMLLYAVLTSRARIGAIALARRYSDFCAQRAIVTASRRPAIFNSVTGPEFTAPRLDQLAQRDARYCGIVVRLCVIAIIPAGAAIVAGASLFVMDATLSVVVLVLLSGTAWYLHRASIKGARYRALMERKARDLRKERRRLTQRVTYLAAPIDYQDSDMRSGIERGAAKDYGDALDGQLQVVERSALVSYVMMAIALFLVFLIQGGIVLRQQGAWSALFAYLGVLSFFTTNLVKSAKMITSINRFYPTVSRYARCVGEAKTDTEDDIGSGHEVVVDRLLLRAQRIGGGCEQCQLTVGKRAALLLPERLDRYYVQSLLAGFETRSGCGSARGVRVWFAGCWSGPLRGSIREIFGFPSGYQGCDLLADVRRAGLPATSLDAVPSDLDMAIKGNPERRLTPTETFLLSALAGYRNGCPLIILEDAALVLLSDDQRRRVLDLFADRVLFVAYAVNESQRLGAHGETVVVSKRDDQAIAWAPVRSLSSEASIRTLFEAQVVEPLRAIKNREQARVTAQDLEDADIM